LDTLLNLPWLAANVPGYLQFRQALANPEQAQRSLLRNYLKKNAGTAFGRAHGFATIRTAEEYRQRVPLALWRTWNPGSSASRPVSPRSSPGPRSRPWS
jgi:hypothetical protein